MLLQEWGDPREEEFYFYMKSYSPVDNVSAAMFIVGLTFGFTGMSIFDSRELLF